MRLDLIAEREAHAHARLQRVANHTAYVLGDAARIVVELRDIHEDLRECARQRQQEAEQCR